MFYAAKVERANQTMKKKKCYSLNLINKRRHAVSSLNKSKIISIKYDKVGQKCRSSWSGFKICISVHLYWYKKATYYRLLKIISLDEKTAIKT